VRADCLDHLRTIESESVDAIITDPPYGISFKSKIHGGIANDDAPFVWWLHDAFRVLKDKTPLLCFCRWDVSHAFQQALAWAGFKVRCQVVWDKGSHGQGDLKRTYAPSHELAILASKGDWRLPGGRPRDVFFARRVHPRHSVHPTQKPVELMRRMVDSLTRTDELVLDPFTGSGSTGEACVFEGRRFHGIEMEPKFVALARRRIAAASRPRPSDSSP